MNARILFFLFFFLMAHPLQLLAQSSERILNFDVKIKVQSDASLLISEEITVRSAGKKIRRGIFRKLPISYKAEDGKRIYGKFTVQSLTRDGRPEPYKVQKSRDVATIYFGDKDALLKTGVHTYVFTYTLTRQLGFFEECDELYWNVTGHEWEFPVVKASCEVQLPEGAHVLDAMAYEGKSGSTVKTPPDLKEKNFLKFSSKNIYRRGEGMTVAVSWPKGFVEKDRPTGAGFFSDILADRDSLLPGISGLGLLLIYYLIAWMRVGKDPEKGTIIPRYEPPEGFSPAMCRILWKKRFDAKAFSASLVNMAVHGGLAIQESRGKQSLVLASAAPDPLSEEEREAWEVLASGPSPLDIVTRNQSVLESAKAEISRPLVKRLGSFFKTNLKWFVPGILFTFPIAFLVSGFEAQSFPVLFMIVWLSIWSLGCFGLLRAVRDAFRQRRWVSGLFLALFSLPFWGGLAAGFSMLYQISSAFICGILIITFFFHGLFLFLLRAPTPLGQSMADQLEGFRLYLSVAEKDRLRVLYSENDTPELFEKFLPYAMALDLENEWGNRFSAVLKRASYSPDWYRGTGFSARAPVAFASSLGKAVSSATPAPSRSSSSSGSSGTSGGSSGGGRGGGGGGGW